MGPAGVGKTTLANAILQRDNQIVDGIHIPKLKYVYFLITNTFMLLPPYLLQMKFSRWFNWSETRAMIYLRGWHHMLKNPVSGKTRAIILDHGPIFRLAFLREFGPKFTRSSYYQKWWNKVLDSWRSSLDIIIWLDTSNEILFERIHSRNRWHEIKGDSPETGYDYLDQYRKSYEFIISKLTNHQGPELLQFDTSINSPDQISNEVLGFLDSILDNQ